MAEKKFDDIYKLFDKENPLIRYTTIASAGPTKNMMQSFSGDMKTTLEMFLKYLKNENAEPKDIEFAEVYALPEKKHLYNLRFNDEGELIAEPVPKGQRHSMDRPHHRSRILKFIFGQ